MKKKLKVKFVDFWPNFNPINNTFLKVVESFFEIEYADKPDVLFYSCYGTEFLKYSCPRIFYSAENIRPDFRFCDFALTFDHLNDPRHFRWPLFRRWFNESDLTKKKNIGQIISEKKGFCSFVVSNALESEKRLNFFHELSNYKVVASGGRYANNVGGPVANKAEFIKNYYFNIAFENAEYPGYTTEKIAEPWVHGCIPIYWGDPLITDDINPNCFINVRDFSSTNEVIDYIKFVDSSSSLKEKYLSAPFFRDNKIPEHLKDEVIAAKLSEFINMCLDGLSTKAAKYWHRPYFYIRKIRGGSRLVKINLR
ncbi:glycosyltransferase family 10 domain-containing protein [Mongoliitalea lutea]|nr:glycosyltransferase family 10 [Mongoliitalea lutea]